MSRVVFDIETVGLPWEEFGEKQQDYLISKFGCDLGEKSRMEIVEEVKNKLAVHPLTGRIVTIAMFNPDTRKGKVYFDPGTNESYNFTKDDITFISGDEKAIIENFWKDIDKYDEYITFNGRSFDCPFIHMRSAINCIKSVRDIVPPRFQTKPHIDLLEVFTWQGGFGNKFTLDFYCKAFGIKSPKEGEVHGSEVPKFFREGKGLEIAEYCVGDVIATGDLFLKWEACAPPPLVKKWN